MSESPRKKARNSEDPALTPNDEDKVKAIARALGPELDPAVPLGGIQTEAADGKLFIKDATSGRAKTVTFAPGPVSVFNGDGKLQLDNPDDPLEGGLTLVAHPKGKAVRRLAAMSGGEKSLTALSFLFALQRFRPSPFYALDEVDSFLDGVNVERLAALIARQAEQAQFLVVSHRRPMIGASTRTIGVTQARGAHTQVVGLPDAA